MLAFQQPEIKILANFKILAFQNLHIKIYADLEFLAFQKAKNSRL